MIQQLSTAAVAMLVAGALSSCFTLPSRRQPEEPPVPLTPRAQPGAMPMEPAAPVAEANAFFETGAASTSFFVSRPESARTDRLPDKILRRGTVVQVLVPEAGASWAKVKLVDAQTGYIPLNDLDIVSSDVRPSGFPRGGAGIDTAGSLELPEPPTAPPSSPSPSGDTIGMDDLELPSSSTIPTAPGASPSDGIDNIPLEKLPEGL